MKIFKPLRFQGGGAKEEGVRRETGLGKKGIEGDDGITKNYNEILRLICNKDFEMRLDLQRFLIQRRSNNHTVENL